jgi:hypothetical protein
MIGRQFAKQTWRPDITDLSEFIGRAAKDGCRGIVSYGLAGSLCPDLRSGDVVVGSGVVGPNGRISTDDIWSAWLLSAIPTAVYGPVVGIDIPIAASASRGELRLRSGALAVDMESHVIAQLATANALRLVVLRVVVDGAERNIPPTAIACVSGDGEVSRWRLSRMLLGRPSDTLGVIRLSTDWRLARKALLCCADVLGASVHAIEL